MIIEQQKPCTVVVRFEDEDGDAVRMPSYDWVVSLFADVPARMLSVKCVGGVLSLSGSYAPMSVLSMDDDECGFKVTLPMTSIGQGEVRYKVVVRGYHGGKDEEQKGETGDLILSKRHMYRFKPSEKGDTITVDAIGEAKDWILVAEDGRYVITEDGKEIDLSKIFTIKN